MMGGRSWDDWIEEYSHSHEHPMNRLLHSIGIPMIALAVVLAPLVLLPSWRAVPIVLFAVGWLFQFVGHAYERKPPEFLKDPRFLFVGLRWWWKKVRGLA